MTYRRINVAFLLLILAIAALYLWMSRDLALNRLREDLRPIMLPVALGSGVVVLSVVELARTLLSRDEAQAAPFRIPGAGRIVATVLLVAAFYLVWQWFGAFYPGIAALVLSLVVVYRWRPTRRDLATATAIAAGFTLLIFVVFDLAFGINFTH